MNWNWIAGFYEGEGSPQWQSGSAYHPKRLRIIIVQAGNEGRAVLEKARRFTGLGKIYIRRHKVKPKHSQTWMWAIGNKEAHILAKNILPKMQHKRKINQLKAALKLYPASN